MPLLLRLADVLFVLQAASPTNRPVATFALFRGCTPSENKTKTRRDFIISEEFIMRRHVSLLLAILAPTCSAWVLFSPVGRKSAAKTYEDGISGKQWASPASFSLNSVALRWGLPTSSIGDEALGSGLAFALHPDFCKRLLPIFPESAEYLQSIPGLA